MHIILWFQIAYTFFILSKFSYKTYKKIFKVIPYTIILTGPIGAGKTTLSHIFTSYLKSKDKNVHLISEAALMDSRALKIFYEERNKTDDILERIKHCTMEKETVLEIEKLATSNKENVTLFFHYFIISMFKRVIESFSRISHQFDVVILDRTPLDTKVFTKMNISNLDYVTFLNSYVSFIELNIDKVVFVQPEFSITVDRVKNRNRSGETCSEDYLHDLFNLYQNDIYEIYPKNKVVVFRNGFSVNDHRYLDFVSSFLKDCLIRVDSEYNRYLYLVMSLSIIISLVFGCIYYYFINHVQIIANP